MGLRLGSTRIPGITLYEEGKVYPKGLVNIDANVPAPLATRVVNVGELSAKRNRTTYNGTRLTANSSFTFNEGDTLSIEVYGEMTGSTIYEDGVLIGSCDINEPYIYSLPNHAINFETFSTSIDAGGEVYITTVYGYDVTNYAFANVTNIPEPVDYFTQYATDTLVSYSNSTVTSLPDYAFYDRSNLHEVNFPVCTTINNYAFQNCSALSTISFPACTSIGQYAFASCYSLSIANFPVCTRVGNSAFQSCSSLVSVDFPACTSISTYAFAYCSSLTTASFPVCTSISNYAFQRCYSLSTISFPNCTSIGGGAFRSCYNLLSLYLTGSSLCSLGNINVFSSTPISTYTTSTGGVHGLI